jgi:hypothetical protein
MALNGDYIESLPKDKKNGPEYEKQKPVIDKVFGEKESAAPPSSLSTRVANELTHSILICVLFILFTLPQVDALILKNVPNSNNMFIMYAIKCFFIIILYYIFRNVQTTK